MLGEDWRRVESPPMADWLEGFVPMMQHVLIRFGKWDEILAQALPDDPELYCTTNAMIHYAKTVAHAVGGNIAEAEAEQELEERRTACAAQGVGQGDGK